MSIIEGLVAIIILLSLYMGYRTFFGKGDSAESESSLDTAKLEQTLEKILQSQASAGGGSARPIVVNAAADEAIPGTVYTVAEVDNIVANLAESDKQIAALQAQLEQAQAGAGAAASAGAGVSGQEKEVFESKIRDLETRLGEYEIISEDIADLARFREENDKLRDENEKLKSEIGLLRSTGAGAAAPPAPTPPQPVAAAAPPPPEPPPPAAAPPEPPPPEEPLDTSSLIDDDLMAEFAAAVENQKAATSADGDPAADAAANLMNDFEDPANKKD